MYSVPPFNIDMARLSQIEASVDCPLSIGDVLKLSEVLGAGGRCDPVCVLVDGQETCLNVRQIRSDALSPNAWWLVGELTATGEKVGVFVTPTRPDQCFLVHGA